MTSENERAKRAVVVGPERMIERRARDALAAEAAAIAVAATVAITTYRDLSLATTTGVQGENATTIVAQRSIAQAHARAHLAAGTVIAVIWRPNGTEKNLKGRAATVLYHHHNKWTPSDVLRDCSESNWRESALVLCYSHHHHHQAQRRWRQTVMMKMMAHRRFTDVPMIANDNVGDISTQTKLVQ
jgi:hypothetical protein